MHTIKTSIGSILRNGLHLARAPHFRTGKPETLRALGDWILRDLGMSRGVHGRALAEHDNTSARTAMLRAFYGL